MLRPALVLDLLRFCSASALELTHPASTFLARFTSERLCDVYPQLWSLNGQWHEWVRRIANGKQAGSC